MKTTLLNLFTLLLCSITFQVNAQSAPKETSFSFMEINHLRVKTPGLFDNKSTIVIDLDSLCRGGFAFPLAGAKVISPYGSRRRHAGADIKTCAKDTIRCPFDGVVRLSKPYSAYGNLIVIRHHGGLETVYSHNYKNFVKSGDVVKAGELIALTGRTGRATTEHLHFETRINGQHFNPNLLFDFVKEEAKSGFLKFTKSGRVTLTKSNPLK